MAPDATHAPREVILPPPSTRAAPTLPRLSLAHVPVRVEGEPPTRRCNVAGLCEHHGRGAPAADDCAADAVDERTPLQAMRDRATAAELLASGLAVEARALERQLATAQRRVRGLKAAIAGLVHGDTEPGDVVGEGGT